MLNKRKGIILALTIVSTIGLTAALFSTAAHWNTDLYGFCELGEHFNCNVVNTSKYATIVGFPVAGLGAMAYAGFLVFAGLIWKKANELLATLAGSMAIVGMGFSLYLSSIEAFVLHTWCVVCITSQICIALILGLVLWLRAIDQKQTMTSS
ncbi:MAG: vitamin K epoxide reductase family protein [Patescibacteria group bacterium]